jgi:hypothetical protein
MVLGKGRGAKVEYWASWEVESNRTCQPTNLLLKKKENTTLIGGGEDKFIEVSSKRNSKTRPLLLGPN